MEYAGIERRTCIRFVIPGATVNYWLKNLSSASHHSTKNSVPS